MGAAAGGERSGGGGYGGWRGLGRACSGNAVRERRGGIPGGAGRGTRAAGVTCMPVKGRAEERWRHDCRCRGPAGPGWGRSPVLWGGTAERRRLGAILRHRRPRWCALRMLCFVTPEESLVEELSVLRVDAGRRLVPGGEEGQRCVGAVP